MPRVNGVMQLPPGSYGAPNTSVKSAPYNTVLDDFVNDANNARPITAGGTGASSASEARQKLGTEIGVNVQAYDAGLQSIAGLVTTADMMIYTTATDVWATTALTPFARSSLLTLADTPALRTLIGLGSLAYLSGINDANWSGTDLSIANGGTGASSAAAARANLDVFSKGEASGAFVSKAGFDTINGDLSFTNGTANSPVIRLRSENNRIWYIQAAGGNLRLVDEGAGAVRFYIDGAGNLFAGATVSAGLARLDTDGNVIGTVWSNWGAADAYSAISLRIEARGLAWRDAAIAQIMPTIASQGLAAVGTYVWAAFISTSRTANPGDIVAGTDLRYANNSAANGAINVGNWRLMGSMQSANVSSLFLRIS